MRTRIVAGSASGLAMAVAAPAILNYPLMTANQLDRLIPDLYAGLDVVSRELVGFVPSVARNASAERAAVGETVVWPVAPPLRSRDTTPAMQIPNPQDVTIGHGTMTITKSKNVEFGWAGEEQRGLNNGVGYLTIQADLFAQALRTLTNEVEADLGLEAARNASRAYGTAGTTPFAGDKMTDSAQLRKILDDNGAPKTGRSLIIDTSAGANLRSMFNLTRVNEAGTSMTLRDGELLDLSGFSVKESAGVASLAGSTSADANTGAGALPVGTTVIPVTGGTGDIVSGDIIQLAGDTNKYVVQSVAGGNVTIHSPGLRVAKAAGAVAITAVTAASVRNIGFSPDALRLAARAPALPSEGDARLDSMLITDPRSGLTFEVSVWPGYRMVSLEVALAWGVKAVKPAHIGALLG